MFDRTSLDQLQPDVRKAVESSIGTIVNSGVVDIQLRTGFESIINGAIDEPEGELAARISKYRLENYGLIALKELADQLKKESN